MDLAELERAWGEHEHGDLNVKQSLALEFARLDAKTWVGLQEAARAEPAKRKHADALAKLAGHVPSAIALERVIARAYQNASIHDEAVRWAAKALVVTPRWDPMQVSATCNTIAWSLYLARELEAAERWARRALAHDPTQPFALGTCCETLGQRDPLQALSVHRFLKDNGYSPALWGDYAPPAGAARAEPWPLSLDALPRQTTTDAHHIVIARRFDTNATEHERHHGVALVLAGAGLWAPALLAARLAAASAEGDLQTQSRVLAKALESRVDPAVAKEIAAGKGRYAKDPEARAKAAKKLGTAKDAGAEQALREMVFDSHYGVSMAACEALIVRNAAQELAGYLDEASAMEHATGQSIYYGGFPKPFDLTAGAKTAKPETKGTGLVQQVIERVKKGGKERGISIPAPEPVPRDVLDRGMLAAGIPMTPAMKEWLAFDGGWLARVHGWMDDPSDPVFACAKVHVVVHDFLSDVFAPAFVDLPGKLAGAWALPLDVGSDSMRLLLLVPGPDGEYPVLYADTDDTPMVGVEAPSFDVWLAGQAGLVGDVKLAYKAEIGKIGRFLFGGSKPYAYTDFRGDVDDYPARLAKDRAAAKEAARRVADGGAGKAAKKGASPAAKKAPVVPDLPEPKLGEAIAQAIQGKRQERVESFVAAAEERYPKGRKWRGLALVAAVHAEDEALVARLLAGGADPNTKSYLQNTVVHAAAGNHDTRVLRALLGAGGDPKARGYSRQTPLFDACEHGGAEAVRVLLAAGADPNARDGNERTPLMVAADPDDAALHAESLDMARALLDAGADPNAHSGQTTPLHEAIEKRHSALASLLIERGADVEATDWDGRNALHAAWASGDLATFDRLAATGKRDGKRKTGLPLDRILQGDGLLPAHFDIRYQCQEAPQDVALRLTVERPPAMPMIEFLVDRAARSLLDMAAAGLLGSDVYPPESGVGKQRPARPAAGEKSARTAKPKSKKPAATSRARSTSPVEERELVFQLGGVSPAGLAFWLRGLRASAGLVITGISLVGSVPPTGPRGVTSEVAEAWLRQPATLPLRAFPGRASLVTEVPARERVGRVKPRPGAKGIEAFDLGLAAAIDLVPAREPGDLRDRVRNASLHLTALPRVEGAYHTLAYMHFPSNLRPAPASPPGSGGREDLAKLDLATARALFENGVAKLAAAGEVEIAEWSLGVAGAAPAEGLDEALAEGDELQVSPSSRATCPKCHRAIEEGELRFAEKTPAGARYHHLPCAADRLPTRLEGALARYDDEVEGREALLARIEKAKGRLSARRTTSASASASASAETTPSTPSFTEPGYPYAETAKTGRATCVKCGKPIAKDTVRVAIPRSVETPQGMLVRPGYLHLACAADHEGVTRAETLANSTELDEAGEAEVARVLV